MNKQLQFELWQECNSRCKFCYLGHENRHTPDELKLSAIAKAKDKIMDLSLYPEYDTIAYIGGEFFQGQLKNQKVKEAFMDLMDVTNWLYENKYIKHIWICATLTLGKQEDLYETLTHFSDKSGLWILTSYDTLGRFHTSEMEKNWDYHMKNIYKLYPEIKFNITTILSGDLIEKYLNDELSFKQMMADYHCNFFFKQCGAGETGDKNKMNALLPNFFPTRKKFLAFLRKFKQEESDYMWTKLFNIYYRADTLYRNFNTPELQMSLNQRSKSSKAEILESNNPEDCKVNTCGHSITYQAYIDSDACVLCDKEMIEGI